MSPQLVLTPGKSVGCFELEKPFENWDELGFVNIDLVELAENAGLVPDLKDYSDIYLKNFELGISIDINGTTNVIECVQSEKELFFRGKNLIGLQFEMLKIHLAPALPSNFDIVSSGDVFLTTVDFDDLDLLVWYKEDGVVVRIAAFAA